MREEISVSRIISPPITLPISLPNPPEPIQYTITLQLTEEEHKLLQEVRGISGAFKLKDGIVKALKLYKKVRSPIEREKRRRARKIKRAAVTATVKVKEDKEIKTTHRKIPDSVRDKVFLKDSSQCSFVGKDGQRCSETRGLQIDHIRPWAYGGDNSEENLRVLCGEHNRFVFRRNL